MILKSAPAARMLVLIAHHNKCGAVKLYREIYNTGLVEAKKEVDAVYNGESPIFVEDIKDFYNQDLEDALYTYNKHLIIEIRFLIDEKNNEISKLKAQVENLRNKSIEGNAELRTIGPEITELRKSLAEAQHVNTAYAQLIKSLIPFLEMSLK